MEACSSEKLIKTRLVGGHVLNHVNLNVWPAVVAGVSCQRLRSIENAFANINNKTFTLKLVNEML